MSGFAYISCDKNERELPQIVSLCTFLQSAGYELLFAPIEGGKDWYDRINARIEQCDLFVAVVGWDRASSTWLAHELFYAHRLNHILGKQRPRLIALRIDNWELPRSYDSILPYLDWLAIEPHDSGVSSVRL